MDMIPHDELKPANGINYAPMIDFLFFDACAFRNTRYLTGYAI